jgi:hypothetical protein
MMGAPLAAALAYFSTYILPTWNCSAAFALELIGAAAGAAYTVDTFVIAKAVMQAIADKVIFTVDVKFMMFSLNKVGLDSKMVVTI